MCMCICYVMLCYDMIYICYVNRYCTHNCTLVDGLLSPVCSLYFPLSVALHCTATDRLDYISHLISYPFNLPIPKEKETQNPLKKNHLPLSSSSQPKYPLLSLSLSPASSPVHKKIGTSPKSTPKLSANLCPFLLVPASPLSLVPAEPPKPLSRFHSHARPPE
jgi:hypothetical protein